MTYNYPYKLVIFDCDGTLVDSESTHNRVFSDMITAEGLTEYTPEKCEDVFLGTSLDASLVMIEEMHDIKLPDGFKQNVIDERTKAMAVGVGIEDAIIPVLDALSNSPIQMAIGSNGNRPAVVASIQGVGFDKYFPDDHIFTFEDVERPKPAPDLYLYICKKFGVDPSEALVVEDTVKGAMAGINGNIDVVGYTGLTHRNNQAERLRMAGCKYNIKTMADLAKIVGLQ